MSATRSLGASARRALLLASLGATTTLVASPVHAAPAAESDAQRAQRLYDEGRARYEGEDYTGALALWGEAYGVVSEAEENDRTRYELLYSIASAHEHAYRQDRDMSHLRRARDLLRKCQSAVPEVFAGNTAAITEEQGRVQTLMDKVVDHMADASLVTQPRPAPGPAAPEPTRAGPSAEPTPAQTPTSSPPPADRSTSPRAAKAMFGVGLAMIGVGAAGLGLMVGGMTIAARADDFSDVDPMDLDTREQQIRRGRTGNGLSVGGIVTAGVLVPVGIVLAVLGRGRMRSNVTASLSREHVGLAWSTRF